MNASTSICQPFAALLCRNDTIIGVENLFVNSISAGDLINRANYRGKIKSLPLISVGWARNLPRAAGFRCVSGDVFIFCEDEQREMEIPSRLDDVARENVSCQITFYFQKTRGSNNCFDDALSLCEKFCGTSRTFDDVTFRTPANKPRNLKLGGKGLSEFWKKRIYILIK